MLWFQAGTRDFDRGGNERKPAGLPAQMNRTSRCWFVAICVLSLVLGLLILVADASAQSKGRKGRPPKAGPTSSPSEQSLTNIPLPIGHEAKGLVLPDFDGDGHLRGKFEAGTAHRIDEGHIGFQQLKIIIYKPENQMDI